MPLPRNYIINSLQIEAPLGDEVIFQLANYKMANRSKTVRLFTLQDIMQGVGRYYPSWVHPTFLFLWSIFKLNKAIMGPVVHIFRCRPK